MRFAPFLLASLVASATLSAQAASSLKYKGPPTQAAITAADAMTRLYIFADDSMMGRKAGAEGGLKGTAYIEREVRRLGLIPAGDNGTFFQAVPLYNLGFDTASKLSAGDTPLVGGRDYYPLHPGGIPRSINGAQVIFAGSTTDTTTLIPQAQTIGKVVLVTGPTPGIARRYPDAAAFDSAVEAVHCQRFDVDARTVRHGCRSSHTSRPNHFRCVVPRRADRERPTRNYR